MFVDVERWFLQLLHANVKNRFLLEEVEVEGVGDMYMDAGDLARWGLCSFLGKGTSVSERWTHWGGELVRLCPLLILCRLVF